MNTRRNQPASLQVSTRFSITTKPLPSAERHGLVQKPVQLSCTEQKFLFLFSPHSSQLLLTFLAIPNPPQVLALESPFDMPLSFLLSTRQELFEQEGVDWMCGPAEK